MRRLAWATWVAAGVAALLGAIFAALAPWHSTSSSVSPASVLRRGNGAEPESLDPQRARSEAALTVLRDVYEGLMALGPDDQPILAAADACEISADGRVYRLHIRAAARWSSGESLRAEDFLAAWHRLVDPRTAAPYAQILLPVRGAADILAGKMPPESLAVRVEAGSVVVELEHPTPYFLGLLAHPATFPVHRASLAKHDGGFAKPGVMVTNGAYVLSRWDFGSHLVADRNPDYWANSPASPDRVEYYSFTDPSLELRAFRGGQLDITAGVPPAQLTWVREHLGAQLHVAPQLAVYYLGFNLRAPPFDRSRSLRAALDLVVDRDRLVRQVTAGGELPAYGLVPPGTAGYVSPVPAYAAQPMSERIARARDLLRQAGLAAHPPVLELRYNVGELHARIALAVAGMWKEALGIDTVLRAEEFKVLLQDIDRGDGVQIFRHSWLADYDDAFAFLQILERGFGINLPHYANDAYDGLLAEAAREPDTNRRAQILERAESLMLEDHPLIPLYFYVSKHLVADGIGGWRDDPMNIVYSKNLRKSPTRR